MFVHVGGHTLDPHGVTWWGHVAPHGVTWLISHQSSVISHQSSHLLRALVLVGVDGGEIRLGVTRRAKAQQRRAPAIKAIEAIEAITAIKAINQGHHGRSNQSGR
eukprot:6704731-Prymnesium_polylepis.1